MPSPHQFKLRNGVVISLHETAPTDVKLLAMRDLMHMEASESSLAKRIGGTPDLVPLKDFLRKEESKGGRGT